MTINIPNSLLNEYKIILNFTHKKGINKLLDSKNRFKNFY